MVFLLLRCHCYRPVNVFYKGSIHLRSNYAGTNSNIASLVGLFFMDESLSYLRPVLLLTLQLSMMKLDPLAACLLATPPFYLEFLSHFFAVLLSQFSQQCP